MRLLRPFLPPIWLAAYWYFCWAARDIRPTHPDLLEVMLARDKYSRLLGLRPARVPDWVPRHWNCRCRPPLRLVRR